MKELKVRNIDGKYFLCADKDEKYFAIEREEMPKNVKIGDTIIISDEGKISIK